MNKRKLCENESKNGFTNVNLFPYILRIGRVTGRIRQERAGSSSIGRTLFGLLVHHFSFSASRRLLLRSMSILEKETSCSKRFKTRFVSCSTDAFEISFFNLLPACTAIAYGLRANSWPTCWSWQFVSAAYLIWFASPEIGKKLGCLRLDLLRD